jgi:cholest-4-en-3-one 26-monooxygenase
MGDHQVDDLKQISRRPIEFSSERQGSLIRDPTGRACVHPAGDALDGPPKHATTASLVNKAFTPRMVDGCARALRRCAADRERVIEKGECDFVEELAAPLPMLVITELMGVPEEDRCSLRDRQQDGRVRRPEYTTASARDEDEGETTRTCSSRADVHVRGEAAREGALEPGQRLATALVNVELDGRKLTPEEFNFFFLLL